MSQFGGVIGVFENIPGSMEEALLIATEGITVLALAQPLRLLYRDIEQLDPPRKIPLPVAIQCGMKDGRVIHIPVRRREGHIMDIYRFLLSAVREERDSG